MARPANVVLRMFSSGDESTLVSIWNATCMHDPITEEVFRRQTLNDPNFSPEACWLADAEDKAVGFVLTVAPGVSHLFAPPPGVGRVTGIGVLPAQRRGKIGARLLDYGLDFLKRKGCGRVQVSAPEYFVAGVDTGAYPDALAFFGSKGFAKHGQAHAMARELYELEWPPEVKQTEAQLKLQDVVVKFYEKADESALAGFFEIEFHAWKEFFDRKMAAGDPFDDIVIARARGRVVGYCQRLEADHIGPFGVLESLRNQGLGAVMLYRLLDRMRQRGYRFAWFGETGRARPFYERAGFKVTRRYDILSRDI